MRDEPTKILIADDDAHLRLLYQIELRRAGFATVPAATAAECLDAVGRWKPDLVVLDLFMPDMDSRSLLAELFHRAPDLPVVVNTADARFADGHGAHPTAEFVLKSADLSRLLRTVRRAGGFGPSPARSQEAAG